MNKFNWLQEYKINLLIVFTWIIFLYLNWITYSRLMFFLIVLEFILIYRIVINQVECSTLFIIKNKNLLNFIIIINKWRNPVLLLLIKFDILMYDLILYYDNILIKCIIYVIYVFIINPIKIFYFKFYKVLRIWKTNKIWNILFNRMFGLILSILIFTNIINFMYNSLHLNILMIIYIYLLLISVLCELIETRSNKWLRIFLVNYINTWSVIANKLDVNFLSIILQKNNINELSLYFNKDIWIKYKYKIEKFQIGYMWYIIDSLKNLQNKPNYLFYYNLRWQLYIYLATRMETYLFFKYYNWNVPNMHLIEVSNLFDINIFKEIYEYDYKVFKILLFLYWDLEYYMENKDYVKDSLIVNSDDLELLNINFKNSVKSDIEFFDKIKYKDLNIFLFENIFDFISLYDINSKINDFDVKYKHYINIKYYIFYEKIFNMVSDDEIMTLRECQAVDEKIDSSYYEGYINEWYKEWESEINEDLSEKYKNKLKLLEVEYQQFINFLRIKVKIFC